MDSTPIGLKNHCTISPSQDSTIPPSQGEIAGVKSERQIYLINGFNELTIQSTIKNSDDDDAESKPSSYPKVSTYTTNRSFQQKLFNNWLIPKIVPGAIRLIDQLIMEYVPGIRETLDACQTVLSKEIVTDAAHSGAHIYGLQWREAGRAGTAPRHGMSTPP